MGATNGQQGNVEFPVHPESIDGLRASKVTFFRIGVIAYDLLVVFKHAGSWVLKLAADTVDVFRATRLRRFAQAAVNVPWLVGVFS